MMHRRLVCALTVAAELALVLFIFGGLTAGLVAQFVLKNPLLAGVGHGLCLAACLPPVDTRARDGMFIYLWATALFVVVGQISAIAFLTTVLIAAWPFRLIRPVIEKRPVV